MWEISLAAWVGYRILGESPVLLNFDPLMTDCTSIAHIPISVKANGSRFMISRILMSGKARL